jgi:hypothetical protein
LSATGHKRKGLDRALHLRFTPESRYQSGRAGRSG